MQQKHVSFKSPIDSSQTMTDIFQPLTGTAVKSKEPFQPASTYIWIVEKDIPARNKGTRKIFIMHSAMTTLLVGPVATTKKDILWPFVLFVVKTQHHQEGEQRWMNAQSIDGTCCLLYEARAEDDDRSLPKNYRPKEWSLVLDSPLGKWWMLMTK